MAAYAALVSLINDLELIPNHPFHSFSFHNKQITSLSETVHFLLDFMESYDTHGCSRETGEILESRIACAAHAAHDVIESNVVDQIHAGSTLDGIPASLFVPDLQKAIDNMDFVKREAMQFQAEQPTYSTPTSSQPLMISQKKNVMVGFDAVVVRLLEKLTGEPSRHQIIIPIVGMGGMGKTTLSIHAYQHSYIEHHVDVRLWATVSQEYSAENIFTQLIFGEKESSNINGLGEVLHKKLWGRRYLVVLDDMWSIEAWDKIHMFLPDNGNGSRVIVTTRLSNLATHLSPSPFKMDFLDKDKSWQLICGKVFGEEECPVELEKTGKKIVERCKGLPLSLVVIGGHLRRASRVIEYWEKVANFMNPISSLDADDHCLKIISLSYEHLPACLKPCFLYTSVFREDEKIYVPELLRFWVAEGFLNAKKGLSLEEVAVQYLEDLIDRNLILVHQRRWNGKVEFCVVHDIVRELCLKVAKKEKFMCVLEDATQALDTERRIVIPEGNLYSDINDALESAPLVRSLIRHRVWFLDDLWVELRSLRLLRVSTNVNNMLWEEDDKCFPAAHLLQVNLRYLAFSCVKSITNTIKRPYLPSSIPLFWNMQTLVMKGVQISAPYEIWEMPQLRHLEFDRVCIPDPLPSERSNQRGRAVLGNLHTLLGVVNFILSEEVCQRMPNIKDLLLIYDHFPSDCSYYCLHNLCRFNKLDSLNCEFGIYSNWRDVAATFEFPTSITELSLQNCGLHWEGLTKAIKSLTRLGSLHVDLVYGPEWDLVDQEFTCLKVLKISRCHGLINLNANRSHFPVLEILDISSYGLSEVPYDFGEIPTLRVIELKGCNASAAVSAVRIVVEQESLENYDIQLYIHFWEMEVLEIFRAMVQKEGLKSNNVHQSFR